MNFKGYHIVKGPATQHGILPTLQLNCLDTFSKTLLPFSIYTVWHEIQSISRESLSLYEGSQMSNCISTKENTTFVLSEIYCTLVKNIVKYPTVTPCSTHCSLENTHANTQNKSKYLHQFYNRYAAFREEMLHTQNNQTQKTQPEVAVRLNLQDHCNIFSLTCQQVQQSMQVSHCHLSDRSSYQSKNICDCNVTKIKVQ